MTFKQLHPKIVLNADKLITELCESSNKKTGSGSDSRRNFSQICKRFNLIKHFVWQQSLLAKRILI